MLMSVTGTGSGPYVASYAMTGAEPANLPVSISFTNSSGMAGGVHFDLGNGSAFSVPVVAPVVISTASGNHNSSGLYTFDRYLYKGMTAMDVADPDVTALQKLLKADGLYSGPITGYFGAQTKTAVELFQKKHGLSQIGSVGPATRGLLNKGL